VQSGFGSYPEFDEAWPYGAGVTKPKSQVARRAPRHQPVLGLHRRFSRRDRARLRGDDGADREIGFDHSFSFILQPPARHARRQPARYHAAGGQEGAGWPGCRRGSKLARTRSSGGMGGHDAAGAGGSSGPQGWAATGRPYREQPVVNFDGPASLIGSSRGHHHRGAAQFPARPAGRLPGTAGLATG